MNEATKPSPQVLFVDDDELAEVSINKEELGVENLDIVVRHPEFVSREDVEAANLVVVDYFLTNWGERDEVDSVARSPMDGLAVAVNLRSNFLPSQNEQRTLNDLPDRSVAFALVSGKLSEASFGLPAEVLPHVFARENNLEWAFHRSHLTAGNGGKQIKILADAVLALPNLWRRDQAEEQLWQLLNLQPVDTQWFLEARVDVLDCRPPIHELSERSHGLVLLRWLLHRILPYPCFLLDELQLCARLRVDSLCTEGEELNDLLVELGQYKYNGVLADFLGQRWWRAGVEDWIYRQTGGDAGNSAAVAALARSKGAHADGLWRRPVVTIRADLSRYDRFYEVEETIRIRPDDWPPFADSAYALRSDVDSDLQLRSLVDPADRHLLHNDQLAQ